jgi:hypothetical protein
MQQTLGIEVDGIVGPETFAAFTQYRTSPDEKLGVQKLLDVGGVKRAAAAAIPGVGGVVSAAAAVGELKAEITSASDQLSAFSGFGSIIEYAQSGLVLAATVIGIGLAGYAAYSWWKSRQTFEGVATPSIGGMA